ncbi:MAG: 30S ribosomal protein S17 [Candidatus Cloacimonetes bacterium]|nr:30S ribosomal protein S17 [Candidatus Cloacimonadota bacterium]
MAATARKVTKIGIVVSDKMDKTAVIEVKRQFIHPLYKKTVRKHKKFKAHDSENECHIGDVVEIQECRPLSKDKRWTVSRIIEKSK